MTKISGYAAAASFLITDELPVNESGTTKKVTGAQILAKTAQGTTGWYAQISANFGTFTAQVDVTGLTITQTTLAGRRYRLTGWCAQATSTTATDSIIMELMEGATQLAQQNVLQGSGIYVSAIILPTAAAHTYKVQISRSGAGNGTLQAAVTYPAYILLEDIGT